MRKRANAEMLKIEIGSHLKRFAGRKFCSWEDGGPFASTEHENETSKRRKPVSREMLRIRF